MARQGMSLVGGVVGRRVCGDFVLSGLSDGGTDGCGVDAVVSGVDDASGCCSPHPLGAATNIRIPTVAAQSLTREFMTHLPRC
ncbi:hypothetical protein GCM10023170_074450 [Phytohabitans houttuyneae]